MYFLKEIPENRGGALLVRAGSILPMWAELSFVGEKPISAIEIAVFPGASGETILYEDDGESLAYRDGEVATTRFEISEDFQKLRIGKREGSFDGMPKNRAFRIVVYPDRIDSPIETAPDPDSTVEVDLT